MIRRIVVVLAVAGVAACGPQELAVESSSEAVTGSAGLSTTETVITFHDSWNISRSNLFTEGGMRTPTAPSTRWRSSRDNSSREDRSRA